MKSLNLFATIKGDFFGISSSRFPANVGNVSIILFRIPRATEVLTWLWPLNSSGKEYLFEKIKNHL